MRSSKSNKRSTPSSASRSRTRKVLMDDSSSEDDHVSNETVHAEDGQISSPDIEASAKDASKAKKRVTKKAPKKLGKKSSLKKASKKMRTDDDDTTSHHSTLTSSSRNKEDNMKGFEIFLKFEQFKKANPNFLNMLESFPAMDTSKKSPSPSQITNERKSRDLAVPPRDISFNDESNSSKKSSIRKSYDRNSRESVYTSLDHDDQKPSAKSSGRNRLSFDNVVSNERDRIPKKNYASREHNFMSNDDSMEQLYSPRNTRYSREQRFDHEGSYGEDKSPQPYASRNLRGYSNISYSNEKESLYGSKIPQKPYAGRMSHSYSHDEYSDENDYNQIDRRHKTLNERNNRYSFYGPNRTNTKSPKSSFSSNMYYSNTAEMVFNNYRNSSTRIDEFYAENMNSEKCETMLNHSHLQMSNLEPRVWFNPAMRLQYMTYCIIGYNNHNDLRHDSKEFYESFAKRLVTELDHIFDTYQSLEINNFDCKKFLLQTLHFNIGAYNQLPGTSVKYLYQCIRDYLYSRKDGIAVVKVEKSTYDYYSKLRLEYGFYPDASRSYFTIDDQKERMNFIIIQNTVYQPIPYVRRQYWLNFSNTVLNACEHICRNYKDNGSDAKDIYPSESEIEKKLSQVHFPLEEYSNETFTDMKFFIKQLQDFVYCLANDIEDFKLWNFNPKKELIEDYLNYRGWFKRTQDEMISDQFQQSDNSNVGNAKNNNDSNSNHENVNNSENVNNNDNENVSNTDNENVSNNDNENVNNTNNENINSIDNENKDSQKPKVSNTDNNDKINVENTDQSNVDLDTKTDKEKTISENDNKKKVMRLLTSIMMMLLW